MNTITCIVGKLQLYLDMQEIIRTHKPDVVIVLVSNEKDEEDKLYPRSFYLKILADPELGYEADDTKSILRWSCGSNRKLYVFRRTLSMAPRFSEVEVREAFDKANDVIAHCDFKNVGHTGFISISKFDEVFAIVTALGLKPGYRHLEIGCGNAFLAIIISILTEQPCIATEHTEFIHKYVIIIYFISDCSLPYFFLLL